MGRMRTASGRTIVAIGFIAVASAFVDFSSAPKAIQGMTFRLRVTFKNTNTSGRQRTTTLYGRGMFAGGHGRVDIDSGSPGPIGKGDVFIIQDTLHTLWGRKRDSSVRRMDAPLSNPLEGISEKLTGVAGLPSDLKVDFDTVSLNETLDGVPARHFRIIADATYPIGSRQIHEKVIVEQWLAKVPVNIVNPFGSRIRGLPELPTTNGDYRAFLNTLAAANRVFGEAVAVKTVTTTTYNYGQGMGEEFLVTVDLLDLKPGDIDEKQFVLPDVFRRKPPPAR